MLRPAKAFSLLSSAAFALLVVTACSESQNEATRATIAQGCTINSECSSPLVCAFSTCHVECQTSRDCDKYGGGLCVQSDKPYRVCQHESESKCKLNSECAGTQVCGPDAKCRDACLTDRDCFTNQVCTDSVCADKEELVGNELPGAPPPVEGAACLRSSDCGNDLVCIYGNCTVECVTAKDCDYGLSCLDGRCGTPGAGGAAGAAGQGGQAGAGGQSGVGGQAGVGGAGGEGGQAGTDQGGAAGEAGAGGEGGSSSCVADKACDTGNPCEIGHTDCSTGAEICVGGTPVPAGTMCRPAAGDCDAAEVCDGIAPSCPADEMRPEGAECRAAANDCDPAEVCSGASNSCPLDQLAPAGTICAGGYCDGGGVCADTCTADQPCNTGNPCEVGKTTCPGGVPTCVAAGPADAGTLCRASAGPCDVDDVCDGVGTTCDDLRLGAGTVCRAASGNCDLAESCDGSSAACPDDAVEPATKVCRAAAGACDVAEKCTGTDGTCPADDFKPSTTVCRASAGVCDSAEKCTGTAPGCPADARFGATKVCRAASGVCDAAEVCDGTATTCPGDSPKPAGTACTNPYADGVCSATSCVPRVLDIRSNTSDFGEAPFTCSLQSDGLVACWGANTKAQIGQGVANATDIVKPTLVTLPASATKIGTGVAHACAVLATGDLWCWGDGTQGQVVPGGTTTVLSPTKVLSAGADPVVEMAGGYYHTCALRKSGAVDCWGQVGSAPKWSTVTRVWASGIAHVSSANFGATVVTTAGQVEFIGTLGWDVDSGATPAILYADAGKSKPILVSQIASGWDSSCAVRTDKKVVCMGHDNGKAGDGLPDPDSNPVPVEVLSVTNAVMVASGANTSYAVTSTGTLWSWGAGELPSQMAGVAGVTSASSGFYQACFVTSGRGQCVGANAHGQLGTGDKSSRNTLTDVVGLPLL
jgi:hypothetical protein